MNNTSNDQVSAEPGNTKQAVEQAVEPSRLAQLLEYHGHLAREAEEIEELAAGIRQSLPYKLTNRLWPYSKTSMHMPDYHDTNDTSQTIPATDRVFWLEVEQSIQNTLANDAELAAEIEAALDARQARETGQYCG